jgi:hypothetical protein
MLELERKDLENLEKTLEDLDLEEDLEGRNRLLIVN